MATIPLPAVTHLPVLIRSKAGMSVDGVGTLFGRGTEISGLHVVTKKEAFAYLDKWKCSSPELWGLVRDVARLQLVQREKNWMEFQKVLVQVRKWVPHFGGDAEIEHIRTSRNWKEAGWAYSGLMSNLLQTARFVVWYSPKDNRLHPGLFCPDIEVAVYATVGMDYLRICKKPGCNVPFIPYPKTTQEYCTPAHGNADRVARFKAAAKRRDAKPARKGYRA
jgi:hypothetical protein